MKSIILLHGALGSKDQMFPLAEMLKNTYEVHSFDFRGHGHKTIEDCELSIKDMVDELDEYVNSNRIDKPIVFGYSMGGYVALCHALLYPGKINRIITLATKFDWSPEIAEKEKKQLDVEMMKTKIPDFVNVLKQRHGEQWEKLVLKTSEMMVKLGDLKPLNDQNLVTIKTIATICIGDRDKMVSLIETENAVNLLPNGILKILEDTRHPFEQINFGRLAEVIRSL